jgi:hypothetical protein
VKVSKKSFCRFASVIFGLDEPAAYFHQTLTFPQKETNRRRAKNHLNRLLDNLHHRFSMISIYIEDLHDSGGIHFHLLLPLFGATPRSTESHLRSAIWDAWNEAHGNKLHRKANPLIRRDIYFRDRNETIYYFTKTKLLLTQKAPVMRWWGVRNRRLLRKHSKPVPRAKITDALERYKKIDKAADVVVKPVVYSPHDMLKLKAEIDADPRKDWDTHKRLVTGLAGKVSNQRFIDFMNGKSAAGYTWDV